MAHTIVTPEIVNYFMKMYISDFWLSSDPSHSLNKKVSRFTLSTRRYPDSFSRQVGIQIYSLDKKVSRFILLTRMYPDSLSRQEGIQIYSLDKKVYRFTLSTRRYTDLLSRQEGIKIHSLNKKVSRFILLTRMYPDSLSRQEGIQIYSLDKKVYRFTLSTRRYQDSLSRQEGIQICSLDKKVYRFTLSTRRCTRKHNSVTSNGSHVNEAMDKVFKEYRRQQSQGTTSVTDSELENGFGVTHATLRKPEVLSNQEKQFLSAVERADLATVRLYLEQAEDRSLNVNCRDALGRSALLLAIEYENTEMMELLLSFNVEVRDALLHAINEENVEAVEMLLKYQQNAQKSQTFQPSSLHEQVQSDSFTPDITPLMLAAHRDNYEIIKILLERGDRIMKPHNVQCPCKDCIAYSNDDILCHSRSRINAYKALASPSLICLSSRDPILTAFELSWELRTLSQLEPEFKSTYKKLSKQVQDFATDLLHQTRGSAELETILNHDTESPVTSVDTEAMTLSRLRLAIKYKQKEFVAHPHCQQLLASIWFEGLPGFRRQHIVYRILMITAIGLLSPILATLYLIAPKSHFGKLMRKPFIKFIVHSSSYILFLFLLILTSQRITFGLHKDGHDKGKPQHEVRGPPPSLLECMITCWVVGLIWAEMKQLWNAGFKEYIHDMWNILDFTTNTLYIATITLRVIAYVKVQDERSRQQPSAYIERKHWNAYDPNLIAEALFAAANIFSALKLVFIFSINPYLGPLQISLGRMVVDITKYGVIYALVNFSFACGLHQLFWYYSMTRQQECDAKPESCDYTNSKFLIFFADLFEIMQTLYFACFGLIDMDAIRLNNEHTFTQFTGKVMFGVYNYISIIVLTNMLIAMMNTSYQLISSQEDTEWKFARSKLWLTYFEDSGTLPAPFNVIPSPKTIVSFIIYVKKCICRYSVKHKHDRWNSIRKIIKKINERERKYQMVLKNLIKRYITNKSRDKIDEGVTEDDMNEIKQDISGFRYELLEVLKTNGMSVSNSKEKDCCLGNRRTKRREAGRMLSFGYCVSRSSSKISNSIDDTESDLKKPPTHFLTNNHHNKLSRSKFGQIVMKRFHRNISSSQDAGEERIDTESSSDLADIDGGQKKAGGSSFTEQGMFSPLEISQCLSEERLLSSPTESSQSHPSQQSRRKIFALSKSQEHC
ncbi:short transient receptor potential channel 4-like [Watersipora subatra]|uniref:short transient receptor potential channel 4-like n=1 Tax=Watersipora subatra TaxID=2589382 RepID=UPI00355BD468